MLIAVASILGVHIDFHPFKIAPKLIAWSEIAKVYTREYSPISEYGGCGYRVRFFKNPEVAYIVKSNIGIQIELTSGKKVLIGTQKQTEANTVVNYNTKKSNNYDPL